MGTVESRQRHSDASGGVGRGQGVGDLVRECNVLGLQFSSE